MESKFILCRNSCPFCTCYRKSLLIFFWKNQSPLTFQKIIRKIHISFGKPAIIFTPNISFFNHWNNPFVDKLLIKNEDGHLDKCHFISYICIMKSKQQLQLSLVFSVIGFALAAINFINSLSLPLWLVFISCWTLAIIFFYKGQNGKALPQ